MSVVKWVLGSNTFDLNPEEDSDWCPEIVLAEQHAPGATSSIQQLGGRKSYTRTASGLTKSKTLRDALAALVGTSVSFSDHFGVSSTVVVKDFKSKAVMDVTNLPPGGSYKYELTLVKTA